MNVKTVQVGVSLREVLNAVLKDPLIPKDLPDSIAIPCNRVMTYEGELVSTIADEDLPFHGISPVKLFFVFVSGSATVKLDQEAVGHSINVLPDQDGGFFLLTGPTFAASITNNSGNTIDYAVVLGGDG